MASKQTLRRRVPEPLRRPVRALRRWPRPRWGNLRRREPFSAAYGANRGTAIDRLYLEDFLERHAHLVAGRVLEVKGPAYTLRYGGDGVARSDVVDLDPDNAQATIIGDLGDEGCLPPDAFDCIILTQTLQLVPDYQAALRNCWQALAPGGSILLSVPTISIFHSFINDLWRWTPDGLETELRRTLPAAAVDVGGYGTLTAALAFLHGIAVEELGSTDLLPADPRYPVLATAHVRKLPPP